MNRFVRPSKAFAVMGLVVAASTSAIAMSGAPASATAGSHLVAVSGSVTPTTDKIIGSYRGALGCRSRWRSRQGQRGLARTIKSIYTKGSGTYHAWLRSGQFDARYAPTAATRGAVAGYLASQGLSVTRSTSPFLVRAVGSSREVSNALHTTLSYFRDPHGVRYFSNSTAVRLPASIASMVIGVVGLSDTVREQSSVMRARTRRLLGDTRRLPTTRLPARPHTPPSSSCRTPSWASADSHLDTVAALAAMASRHSKRTPSTTRPRRCARVGQGREHRGALSAYQQSDINTWAHTFYGPSFTPPLVDVNVDGGPLSPVCPTADVCPASYNGYAGDIEVDADIELQLDDGAECVPPDRLQRAERLHRPDRLDEYTAIANANVAASISWSWAVCENDAGVRVRPGGERGVRADGAAGTEHVRRRRGHGSLLVHPVRRHHHPQRSRPARASPG